MDYCISKKIGEFFFKIHNSLQLRLSKRGRGPE
jgi:hypothetical protein